MENLKDILQMIKPMGGEFLNIMMGIHSKENMKKIELVDMENIQIKMVQFIMDIGLMIYNLG